jgi:hypothetical protein
MVSDNQPPVRARRWKPPPDGGSRPSRPRSYRFVLRLLVIPVLAVVGVFIYKGIRDRLVLPTCDSDRAKQTLSEVLKELKLEPVRYEPLNTVSSTKDQVVCNAVLPLPDGANVAIDYSFYWQGDKANMKYSVSRKAS